MSETPADRFRRLLLSDPGRSEVYDALTMTLGTGDLPAAARAARQACAADPGNRRLRKNLLFLLQRSGSWDLLDRWTPRQRRSVPARRSHPVDLDRTQARYDWLMKELDVRQKEGWTPSRVEHWKRSFTMSRGHLANFRRSELSSGTQNPPDRPVGFPSLDFSRLYPDVSAEESEREAPALRRRALTFLTRLYRQDCPEIDWFDALAQDDNRFGARVFDVPGLGTATFKGIQSAYYACRVASLVPKGGVVLEIGGGFGAVASRLLAIRPDITYVLTDLPVNMVLTHTYLTSLYGDAVVGLWEDGDHPSPEHRALVVPPWRLADLPLRVDLAINTMSFQHMDERNHAFYGEALRKLGTRRLYHLNRNVHLQDPDQDTMVVPAERYGFMADYEVTDRRDFNGQWIEVIAEARSGSPRAGGRG